MNEKYNKNININIIKQQTLNRYMNANKNDNEVSENDSVDNDNLGNAANSHIYQHTSIFSNCKLYKNSLYNQPRKSCSTKNIIIQKKYNPRKIKAEKIDNIYSQ